jgi:hypothetical protein
MAPSCELICHHTYAGFDGLPVDLSDYDSHGQAIDAEFFKDGVVPGTGALRFAQPQSRVHIPVSPAWQTLGGIKVEITARLLTRAAHWQMLIAGDGAFSFFLREHILFATFAASPEKSTWPLADSDGITSANGLFTPSSFPTYPVPTGKWMTFGFLHDGLDRMELFIDGQLIARRTGLLAGVPGVGPLGVSIGNSPGNANHSLQGDIDEVKVWRLNPRIVDTAFFSRPVDTATAECWTRFLQSLAGALDRDPRCAQQILATLADLFDRVQRAIVAKGPETRERFNQTSQKYLQLWQAGELDGPEMAQLFADWCAWMRLVGLSFEDDPAVKELLRSDCLKKMLVELEPLDCDPQAAALVHLIMQGCQQGTKAGAAAATTTSA